MRTVPNVDTLSQLNQDRLNTIPDLPAGIDIHSLVNSVLVAIDTYNNVQYTTNHLERPLVIKPCAGQYAYTMAYAYNLDHVFSILCPEYRADLQVFLTEFKNTKQLSHRISSAGIGLEHYYTLINPYGKPVDQLLVDVTSAGTSTLQTESSIKNLRSVRRSHEISVIDAELNPIGKRDGKGKAQPINPATGRYLYESRAGQLPATNLSLVSESPLYLFHARAWGRVLWANALIGFSLDRCPYNRLTVRQLQQGVRLDETKPPSIDNGGWWYVVEAEDYAASMAGQHAKVASHVVLPFYIPTYKEGKPLTTIDDRYDALNSMILKKVGVHGLFNGNDYRSAIISGTPSATPMSILNRIIHDEKIALGLDPTYTVRDQLRVVPDYAVDLEAKVDSASRPTTQQELIEGMKALSSSAGYSDVTVTEEVGTTNIVPFAEPAETPAEKIARLRAKIAEAARLQTELEDMTSE